MASALDRLLAANEAARKPIRLPHRADPSIVVTYRLVDPDDTTLMDEVPMSEDRTVRRAATLLGEVCIAIEERDGDGGFRSLHPDGDTVTFASPWLATQLGLTGDDWTPADVVAAFYPLATDLITTNGKVMRASGMMYTPDPI